MAVLELTNDNFKEAIENGELPVIVDFYANWCGPCRMIAPLLEQIAEENSETIKVCKLNVDESKEIAIEFNIMSIPCVISFKAGKEYKRIVGARPKEDYLTLAE